jgi:iron-sulfur cluster assembly protein
MTIIITEPARQMLTAKLAPGQFLRVGIAEGGCAGLTYKAEISGEAKDGDSVVLESGPIRVVATPESARYLDGLTIDYSDDLIGGGLRFTNANTQRTCGCGASFSLSGFPVIDSGKCCG